MSVRSMYSLSLSGLPRALVGISVKGSQLVETTKKVTDKPLCIYWRAAP